MGCQFLASIYHLCITYHLWVITLTNNCLSRVLLRLGKAIENISLNLHMLNIQFNASVMCLQNIKVVTIDYSERACQLSNDWIASWLFQLSKLSTPILELKLVLKVIFYSDKITIPALLQLNMLLQFHISYQRLEKTHLIVAFWIWINRDIEEMVAKCPICLKYQLNIYSGNFCQHESSSCPTLSLINIVANHLYTALTIP